MTMRKGNSFLYIDFLTAIGIIIALNPKISVKFATFDPMTFPIAMSAVMPCALAEMEAAKLTASSGNDVPNATNVNPMMSGETLNLRAIELDDTMKKSAPLISKTNPTIKNKTCNAISIPIPL